MYGNLACLCAENKTLDTYEVTYVEESLEQYIVCILVFTRAQVVACDIYLYTTL